MWRLHRVALLKLRVPNGLAPTEHRRRHPASLQIRQVGVVEDLPLFVLHLEVRAEPGVSRRRKHRLALVPDLLHDAQLRLAELVLLHQVQVLVVDDAELLLQLCRLELELFELE